MKIGKLFVPLPQDLVASPAWRSIALSTRRLIDFLMLEHMRHHLRRNGFLMAPRRQLEAFGLHPSRVTAAVAEAERVGLVDCIRGKGRAASRYALTWLQLADGTEPSNRWRSYQPEKQDEV